MKIVFPCNGSFVLLKQDLETLKAFYNSTVLTSKFSEIYKNANTILQVGNFTYLPTTSSIVLSKSDLLSIEKMRKILKTNGQTSPNNNEQELPTNEEKISNNMNNEPISDKDLLSNPFFQTLKPVN